MLAAFGFLYVNDFPAVPLNYYLGLQRMAFFFPNNTPFGLLSGGLWGFPSHPPQYTESPPISF
jgi:hypothetical protein